MARIPHPFAGKSGEGPPVAPINWKWRAGNRMSDMYFYSPSGKKFRSRPELANYLSTLDNPPDANLFCWKVTDEVMKNGYGPGDGIFRSKAAKVKAQNPGGGGNKRLKTSQGKLLAQPPISFGKASDFAVQSTSPLFAPGGGPQGSTMVFPPTSVGHQVFKRIDRSKGKRVRVGAPRSFKSILAGRSSFKWLYDSDTLAKFLEEARRLKHRSAAEINEIRNVLLERQLDVNNICKYPNSAIRVFVRLLRNEEAPDSMGKIELTNLCVNWKCKKRNYWCPVEVGRTKPPRKLIKIDDSNTGCGRSPSKRLLNYGEGVGFHDHANGLLDQWRTNANPDANIVPNVDTHARFVGIGPDSVGGMLRAEDLSSSERAFLRQADSTTVVSGKIERIPFHGLNEVLEGPSKPLSPIVVHRDPSLDSASTSEAFRGSHVQVLSAEPVLSANIKDASFRRQTEAGKLQNDSQPVSAAGSAPDLYGESIVVITGFRSSASKGTGIVHHGDDAAQLNGRSPARDNFSIGASSGLHSTSCKAGEMHFRTSVSVTDTIDGTTQRNGNPEPHISDSQRATLCQESDRRWNAVQRSCHTEEPQRSGSSASALHDGAPFGQGDNYKRRLSDVTKLGMANVRQNPCLLANVDDAASPTKDPAPQFAPVAVKQEPPVPQNEDVCPIAVNGGQVAHLSEAHVVVMAQGTSEKQPSKVTREENLALALNQATATRDTAACWCKICGNDFSFCRGCMCSLCRKILRPGEDDRAVKCSCGHVCHMDCALAANVAGVVKERGLDGELLCPSCSRKVDLWLFFQSRFDQILSLSEGTNVNMKGLEKLLIEALQLLKGTEKIKYKFIEGLVTESYELIRKFPVLSLVQSLLRAVRDELHACGPSPDAEAGEGRFGTRPTAEEIDWLKDEHLAWESFDNAKNERLSLERVVSKVHIAYADAVNKRKQARSAPRDMTSREPRHLNAPVDLSVLEELLKSQQATVDQAVKKLWDLRKFDAEDFKSISALDAGASAWIESLKLQRVIVESAQTKLRHLKNLHTQSIEP